VLRVVRKHRQVLDGVVLTVPVLMVNDGAGRKRRVLTCDSPCHPLLVPTLVIALAVIVQPMLVAGVRTVVMDRD
jgi:hypothetical protein